MRGCQINFVALNCWLARTTCTLTTHLVGTAGSRPQQCGAPQMKKSCESIKYGHTYYAPHASREWLFMHSCPCASIGALYALLAWCLRGCYGRMVFPTDSNGSASRKSVQIRPVRWHLAPKVIPLSNVRTESTAEGPRAGHHP